MQNTLITGAYGFVGTNLSNHLKGNHTLWGLDVSQQPSDAYSHYYSWNELETLPWDNIDTVIHLAGKAHDTKNQSDAQSYFDINTGLTQKIFDYFLQSKAKQFIFFSSVKAAADVVEGDFLTEDVIPKPVGPYGESKIRAEEYIQLKMENSLSTFNSQLSTEKRVYILRPCMIHGPGNKGNLNLLYNVVKRNIPYPLGAFDNKRSFLNVWNLSHIIEQIIIKSPDSGIYHLADDDPVSTNTLIRFIAESQGKKAKIWKWNKSFINCAAKVGDICKLPINSERLQKLTENYVVSNNKIKNAIGIAQLPVKADEGFMRTLKSFKNDNN